MITFAMLHSGIIVIQWQYNFLDVDRKRWVENGPLRTRDEGLIVDKEVLTVTNISDRKMRQRKSTDQRALDEGPFNLVQTCLDASQWNIRNQMSCLCLGTVIL